MTNKSAHAFYRKILIATICLLTGAMILCITGGAAKTIGVPFLLLFCATVAAFGLKKKPVREKDPLQETPADPPIISQAKKTVESSVAGVDLSVIGTEYRRGRRREFEAVVDDILDKGIDLILSRIDAHTAAIFFPAGNVGYSIRRYRSQCALVNGDAVIYPGVGVIGAFLKNGLKQLKLTDIVTDSMTLYYYTQDAGIRSLLASPIIADGVERGVVIVDSTEKNRFTDEDHAFLATIAGLVGRAVYHAYLYNQHRLDHERLVAMSNTEKYFFQEGGVDGVLDKLVEIIPVAFHCERLCISLFDEHRETGAIGRVWGQETDGLLNMPFSLKDKSLANIVFNNFLCLFRNFSEERYEIRHSAQEPPTGEFRSFLAYPLGVDRCGGMILLESCRKNAYTERSRDLMARLVSSASVAIKKIQILHQTENLAIRDGLTGLYNHRQFQILLKEAITRSVRYDKPLALVLCDIDHFKKVNDTYGHRFGDTVLKSVAAKLQSGVREGIDNAARYGGEEFALILAETGADQAFDTVDRLRRQIGETVFQNPPGKEMQVTMSFGIAVYGLHAKNQEHLITRADKALYKAKENGRNRVERYYDANP